MNKVKRMKTNKKERKQTPQAAVKKSENPLQLFVKKNPTLKLNIESSV